VLTQDSFGIDFLRAGNTRLSGFCDGASTRASDVVSYGVGAGALVLGLAVFSLATRKNPDK